MFMYVCLCAIDNEDCSPLLAEYFRTKKMLDDEGEAEEKQSQLIFEITSDDGLCVHARTCDGKMTWIVLFVYAVMELTTKSCLIHVKTRPECRIDWATFNIPSFNITS